MSENLAKNPPQQPHDPDSDPTSMTSHEVARQPSQAVGEDEESGEGRPEGLNHTTEQGRSRCVH